MDANPVIASIITIATGGALAAGVKAWNDIRAGGYRHVMETVGSLRKQRDEEIERARLSRLDSDHYHALVGQLLFQLSGAGIQPCVSVADLVPPSHRVECRPPPESPPAAPRRGRRTTAPRG